MQRAPKNKNGPRIIAGGIILAAILLCAWCSASAAFSLLKEPSRVTQEVDENGIIHFSGRGQSSEREAIIFICLFAAATFTFAGLSELLFRRRFGVSLLELYFDP